MARSWYLGVSTSHPRFLEEVRDDINAMQSDIIELEKSVKDLWSLINANVISVSRHDAELRHIHELGDKVVVLHNKLFEEDN